jgi:hypothetical protein
MMHGNLRQTRSLVFGFMAITNELLSQMQATNLPTHYAGFCGSHSDGYDEFYLLRYDAV